jgi:hypothetical protein
MTASGQVSFEESRQSLGNADSLSVKLHDLDGDGDLDIFATNEGTNAVWLNDGSGFFVSTGQLIGSATSYSVAFSDFDGDDDADAFVANHGPNKIWLNNGNGTFIDSGLAFNDHDTTGLALGDMNSDGTTDVFFANFTTVSGPAPYPANEVWLNHQGTFIDSGQALQGLGSQDVLLEDFDADGDLDAFVVNHYEFVFDPIPWNNGNPPDQLWLNDGHGVFTDSGQRMGDSIGTAAACGDVDGDGDLDILVGNFSANYLWLNNGSGIFSGPFTGVDEGAPDVELADIDSDGDLDAIIAKGGANRIWLNDGVGHFIRDQILLGNSISRGVALGDLDGDGDLDIVFANAYADNGQNQNKVYFNTTCRPDANGPIENQSTGQRFASIQCAINDAMPQDVIQIEPGVYLESVALDKDITLQSIDPNDPYYIGGTIIQGDPNEPVVTLNDNTASCILAGLTIRAGSVGISGTATDATIRNCRIIDNLTQGLELSEGSSPHLDHCLITANGQTGITMHPTGGRRATHCQPTIEDCVIVDNGDLALDGGEPAIIDSIVQD